MNKFLNNHPKIEGLSRNKIILVISIFLIVVFILMLGGVFSSNTDTSTPQIDDLDGKYNHNDTNASINQIIYTANEDKAKLVASKTISTKLEASDNNATSMIPPIMKNMHITPLSGDDNNSNINTPQNKYKQGLEIKKYDSYAAKTLMYSKPLLNNPDQHISKVDASSPDNNLNKSTTATTSGNVADLASNDSGIGGNSDPNMQIEKKGFLKNNDASNQDYLNSKLMLAKSPYEVKAGSIIPSTMISGLNSDLPGQLVAQVRDNVYDSATRQYLLIPQGAKLIGLYDSNVAYGQERVLVIWNRLIYPNGNSINLKGMPGTDLEGYAGFHDIVDNKYWKLFGTSFIMGVITGAMQYSQNNTNANVQTGGLGITNTNPTIGQTMAGSLGQQLGQTGLSITQKNLNVQPTLIIRPGYPFNVMITADMILNPYPKS